MRGIRKGENLPCETESRQLAIGSLKPACRPARAILGEIARIVNGYPDLRLPEARMGLKTVRYKNPSVRRSGRRLFPPGKRALARPVPAFQTLPSKRPLA